MKHPLYIIPGLGESTKRVRYQKLGQLLKKKGYKIVFVNPNWHKPISEQVFTVEKNATLIGFSMGAVLAYLIAKNSPCKKVIFASLSPLHTFDFKEDLDLLSTYMSRKRALPIAEDWHNIKISLKTLRTPFVRLLGEYEKGMGTADILVPKGKHFVGRAYREEIVKLV